MNTRSRKRGITLVELVTTIGVASIALTLGVPTFDGVRTDMQRRLASQELMTSVTLARSEAARRGVTVRLCASADGAACAPEATPSWSAGWLLATDLNENGALDGADEIIHSARFPRPGFSLSADLHDGSRAVAAVAFRGSGFPDATGSFDYRDSRESRLLCLGYVGRLEQIAPDRTCP